MKVSAPVEIGGKVYMVEAEGETMADIVRQIAPWQAFEAITGGKEDVIFSHRKVTKDGDTYEYYALMSPSDNVEFPLGLSLKTKGQLFPGKVIKTPQGKKTVRAWQAVQYGAQVDDDDHGEQSHTEPPAIKPQASTPPQQTTKLAAVPKQQASNQPDPADLARTFVAMNAVHVSERNESKHPIRWIVGTPGPGPGVHEVWYDDQTRPQCNCPELLKARKGDPGFRCAHILAVKLHHDQNKAAKAA